MHDSDCSTQSKHLDDQGRLLDAKCPRLLLNDSTLMPQLGFGTSQINGNAEPGQPAYEAIKTALKCGYRMIDTASLYDNELLVGRALRDAINERIVERSQLFICTKVWNTSHKRQSVIKACRDSLRKLSLDYVDLYLIHWPIAYAENGGNDLVNPRDHVTGKILYSDTHFTETWNGMEQCKRLGLARSIGLSNFNIKQCQQILAMCEYKPTVNQVELHAYLSQHKLKQFSDSVGMKLCAYCPLGAPGADWAPKDAPILIDDPVVARLAKKHSCKPAQILLAHLLAKGIAPIPKSITPERILENMRSIDVHLDAQDVHDLDALNRGLRYCTNTAGEYVHDHPLYPFRGDDSDEDD